MENMSKLKIPLQRGDFLTCTDLNSYLSVHLHETFAFQTLSFGLITSSSQDISKTSSSLPAKKGIRIVIHLDDFLILDSSTEEPKPNTQLTLNFLQQLGFTIINSSNSP